ncbi:hypothetical protein GCM10023149_12970 [Mucilaginibacter gynuensis]|uniref:Uncharacterized protein n=1 Tax=Mucilaginibacter gynuensis TaxID=1302236 RepID=A0ABP8G2V3_9SPHI
MKIAKLLLLLIIPAVYISCNQKGKPGTLADDGKPSFAPIVGVKYTEVRRAYANGLKFDSQGFQLVPSYKLHFLTEDSVSMYSPQRDKYFNFKVYFDHDSIFNMANAWYKLKTANRDSMVLQVMNVDGKTIYNLRSNIYVLLYSEEYLKKQPAGKIARMGQPSKQDTDYIRSRTQLAVKVPDSSFAALQPATVKSKSPLVKVERNYMKIDSANSLDAVADYLLPEYNITINKAYANFGYAFTVYVDDKGVLHFRKPKLFIYPENYKATVRVMSGIVDGYLKLYLNVTPGTTLGIPHSSVIVINVRGIKG